MSTDPRCDAALARLVEFMDNELAAADATALRAHLADCEGCMAQAQLIETVKRAVRRSCTECAPEELRVRVVTQITTLRMQYRP